MKTADEFAKELIPHKGWDAATKAIEARDREVRVGLLKDCASEMMRQTPDWDWWTGARPVLNVVAKKHGIPTSDFYPQLRLRVEDIKVVPSEPHAIISCGKFRWADREWLPNVYRPYSPHDAEAIAAHLRSTNNVPEGLVSGAPQ